MQVETREYAQSKRTALRRALTVIVSVENGECGRWMEVLMNTKIRSRFTAVIRCAFANVPFPASYVGSPLCACAADTMARSASFADIVRPASKPYCASVFSGVRNSWPFRLLPRNVVFSAETRTSK